MSSMKIGWKMLKIVDKHCFWHFLIAVFKNLRKFAPFFCIMR